MANQTIDDLRKQAHDTVDRLFVGVKPTESGEPSDNLVIEEKLQTEMRPSGGVVEHGRALIVVNEYKVARVMPVGDFRMLVRSPQRVYALANQTVGSLNHLVSKLKMTPEDAADALATQTPVPIPEGMTMSQFTMACGLLFNDVTTEYMGTVEAKEQGTPRAPEPAAEDQKPQEPTGDPSDTKDPKTVSTEPPPPDGDPTEDPAKEPETSP